MLQPAAAPAPPLPPSFGWRRLRVVLLAALVLSVIALIRPVSFPLTLLRFVFVGLCALALFGLFERWPRRLPAFVARWAVQVIAVAVQIPFAMAIAYALTTWGSPDPWYKDVTRMQSYSMQTMLALLSAPWIAVSALLRQIKDEARHQALAFELERSHLERQALDGRLRLLQAQVEPHFLFNTLANIRELVVSGSAQASSVLDSLIAYLRAAVPRLQAERNTLEQEFELARAYLEVMQMRMPDRLQHGLALPDDLRSQACPPMLLLTLVENAVRHGIDPSVHGGRIDIAARRQGQECWIEVADSGVGLRGGSAGLGTGLATLRERLQLAYGGAASLKLSERSPRGVLVQIRLPLAGSVA